MDKELWVKVPTFERYSVNNLAEIRNDQTGKILSPPFMKSGRARATLYSDQGKKRLYVSQVVAMAFLGYVPDGTHNTVVDHRDNDLANDLLSNLKVITHRENSSKDQWRKNPKSRYVGVGFLNGQWRARIRINNKLKHLGFFETEEEAHQVYLNKLAIVT